MKLLVSKKGCKTKSMIFEVRVFRPDGTLKKVHEPKNLKKRYWEQFNLQPMSNIGPLTRMDPEIDKKPRLSRAKPLMPRRCKVCQMEFFHNHPRTCTCSDKCRTKWLLDYCKNRRKLIKEGKIVPKTRGPNSRRNVARI